MVHLPLPRPLRARVLAMVLALAVAYYGFNFVQVWRTASSEFVPGPDVDGRAAVVLGAAQYNGNPSPVLQARLNTAAELYHQQHVDLVVVTGGGQVGDVTTEAKTGYDYLRASGIPDSHIRLEVQGESTYESLAATSRFLAKEGVEHVVLVTDGYHMYRSVLVANEVGLSPVAAPTSHDPTLRRLLREGVAVSIGRLIGFRRLDQL